MTGEQVLAMIGGVVIVLGLAAAIYTAFIVSTVAGVLGLLILVVVGVLFSRQLGRDDRARSRAPSPRRR